jgi:2-oxoglutarate ferredoxin oxidoreductase subunit delta
MPKVKINKERCKGCYLCIAYCPVGMLDKDSQLNVLGIQAVVFKEGKDKKCTGCGLCAIICPDCAIEVEK